MTSVSLNRMVNYTPDRLTTGQETIDRLQVTAVNGSAASQSLRLTFFTARKTETITQVRQWTGSQQAVATPTLIRFGIYSEAANGDISLIGSTANDTTLLAAANTSYTKALSVATPVVAGLRYAFGILVVSGSTMPSYYTTTVTAVSSTELAAAPRRTAAVAAQADLPASVVAGSLAVSGLVIYSVILP